MSSVELSTLSQKPLQEILYYLLDSSIECKDDELVHWAKLELGGYTKENDELQEADIVPSYRIVSGQYFDQWNRPMVVADSQLLFILEYPLRNSVAEFEALTEQDGMLEIKDIRQFEMIEQNLKVRPWFFRFPVTMVKGVLAAIRTQTLEKIRHLRTQSPSVLRNGNNTTIVGLHPLVLEVAERLFEDGHYRQAILDTYIALVQQVKGKSGRYDLDGAALMQQVFSAKTPKIIVSDDPDEQLGYMWMFSGAVMGIRNPKAHRITKQTDPQRTLEWLHFASVLFRVLDDARVTGSPD